MSDHLHTVELGNSSLSEVTLTIPQAPFSDPRLPTTPSVPAPSEKPLPFRFATPNEAEIAQFKALYFERHGVSLEPNEAAMLASKYIHMMQILIYED